MCCHLRVAVLHRVSSTSTFALFHYLFVFWSPWSLLLFFLAILTQPSLPTVNENTMNLARKDSWKVSAWCLATVSVVAGQVVLEPPPDYSYLLQQDNVCTVDAPADNKTLVNNALVNAIAECRKQFPDGATVLLPGPKAGVNSPGSSPFS